MMSVRQDWGTPQAFFNYVEECFGLTFTLDACASDYNYKVSQFYTKEDNALIQEPCYEKIWMNPPFGHGGKLQRTFIEKAVEWSGKNEVWCLIPSRTDTRLFHEIIVPNAKNIYFIKGRLNFEGPNREGCNNSTFPSMLVRFRKCISEIWVKPQRASLSTLEPTPKERGF